MAFAGSARPGLRELALGWPLGYALELAAFALTAACGDRGVGRRLLTRRRRRAEPESKPYYGYVAAGVAAGAGIILLARRHLPDVRPSATAVAVACAVGLAVWATDGPPGAHEDVNTPPAFYSHLLGEATWSQDNSNLTPALHSGMRWIADHTPDDAVLAVNNRWQDAAGFDPRYCYWSAYAERRVMLECELGTELNGEFATFGALQAAPTTAGGALPDRARLEYQMFYAPDAEARAAAQESARRYGVTHAVLDLVHPLGAAPRNATRLGPIAYRNDALIVVRLTAPPPPPAPS